MSVIFRMQNYAKGLKYANFYAIKSFLCTKSMLLLAYIAKKQPSP